MTKREMAEMYQRKAKELLKQAEAEENALAAALADAEKYKGAYQTAYGAFFDGLKFVHDPESAFPIELPMQVKDNFYYKDNDGRIYVAVDSGEVNEENFNQFLEPIEISIPEE